MYITVYIIYIYTNSYIHTYTRAHRHTHSLTRTRTPRHSATPRSEPAHVPDVVCALSTVLRFLGLRLAEAEALRNPPPL